MFKKFKKNAYMLKILPLFLALILVTGAHGAPIVKNQSEDLDVIISQIIGSSPNVVTILDLSGSMGRNFGGEQIGDWDGRDVFDQCGGANWREAFCAENIANLTICSSRTCTEDGHRCESAEDLDAQLACVTTEGQITQNQLDNIYDRICGNNNGFLGENIDDCNTAEERNRAAAAMEAAAGLTQCSVAANCQIGSDRDPSCDTNGDFTRFRDCMEDNNLQNVFSFLQPANCTGGTTNCFGDLERGSSRMDVALNVIFNVLDADGSLDALECNDSNQQYDGTNNIISCKEWMETPYRFVRNVAHGSSRLSIPGPSNDVFLRNELTTNDSDILGVRFLPMSYAGSGNGDGCTQAFRMASGGFQTDHRRVWNFYRRQDPSGGTPLARILGFDDSSSGTTINDAIRAFNNDISVDESVQCRPQFVIVITDGDDSCSGDCSFDNNSCTGIAAASNNSNRRSSIQAVSNIRTYFARNPTTRQVDLDGDGTTETQVIKKEVIVFVIGLGITNPNAVRALHGMAMAGGTHTTGIIKHIDPATGNQIGSVIVDPANIDSVLPGTAGDNKEVFRSLAKAENIDTAPASAWLTNCLNPDINGHCDLDTVDIFDNTFFDDGLPFTDLDINGTPDPPVDSNADGIVDNEVNGFAFLVNSPQELIAALNDILTSIEGVSTSGVSPAAPQSSTAVALRDRIFLSILTPVTAERLWQGRLASYAFVDDPDNVGGKVVIRKPDGGEDLSNGSVVDSLSIFDNDGTLNENAKKFFWEASKELTERDLAVQNRNLYTVTAPDLIVGDNVEDPPFSGTSFDTSSNVIRYTGPLVPLNDPINPLDPGRFGISQDDVTDPIPEFCVPEGMAATFCETPTGSIDCSDVTNVDCIACVKDCIRDEVVDFLEGNTGIPTVTDPMGTPTIGNCASGEEGTMGCGCPDPEDDNEDGLPGSLDMCSVRMGDIFHSSPVIVGSPSPLFFDRGFQQFAIGFRERSAVVYVGANDGFLHAFHAGEFIDTFDPGLPAGKEENPFTLEDEVFPFFDEGTGFELFGIAMPTYLPDSLTNPASQAESPAEIVFGTPPPPDFRTGDFKNFIIDNSAQRSFSDGSPVIADVFIDGFENGLPENPELCSGIISTPDGDIDLCGREWHTVLVSGSRNGGGAYMAIDITNPACGNKDGHGTDSGECDNSISALGEHVTGTGAVEYPEHLWTLFDRDFGNTWSTPTIGRIRLTFTEGSNTKTVDRWVMFVGGGADPLDINPADGVSFGNAFVVVDLATGKEIFKFHPVNPIPGGLDAPSGIDEMACDVTSRVGAFDINADGYIDIVYFGDTCGRLWRFDVSKPIDVSGSISDSGRDGGASIVADEWSGEIIFCANTDTECFNQGNNTVPQNNLEPIFFAPTVALDDLGRRHVIFLSGDRRDPSNITKAGKLYNIIDNYIPDFLAGGTAVGSNLTKSATDLIDGNQVIDLDPQSGVEGQFIAVSNGSFNVDKGEFLVVFPENDLDILTDDGEKGFGAPVVINRVLIFTTFAPDTETASACTSGSGIGNIFAIDFNTGEPALIRIPGATNSGILKGTEAQNKLAAGVAVAEGMPTPAQLTFGARGSVLMSVAFTGGPIAGGSQFLVWELPPFPTKTQTLFWEELL